jgi:hypothetical protein
LRCVIIQGKRKEQDIERTNSSLTPVTLLVGVSSCWGSLRRQAPPQASQDLPVLLYGLRGRHGRSPCGKSGRRRLREDRNRPLRGTPVFDRDKDSPTSVSAQHAQDWEGSGDARTRSRFEKEHRAGRDGTSDASETPNLKSGTAHLTKTVDDLTGPLTARRNAAAHVTRSVEGSVTTLSEGSAGGASPRSGKLVAKKGALQPSVNAGSLVGTEEGPGYMTFNDLMRMAEKMALYSPRLNLNKVRFSLYGTMVH